jgi:CDP-paratose 2-epimerase
MHDYYMITGGAGFIGTNLADYYLSHNKKVIIFDNFSRIGTEENMHWLKRRHGKRLNIIRGDIRACSGGLLEAVENVEVVFHLAAQVAVTTSVSNPREDFEVNALGTFNVLEAVRRSSSKPIVVYSSTNKVYGKMADLEVIEKDGRYAYSRLATGVTETHPLDFYSPYGCSKGIGDQYVLDYARIYGLRTVVFRQSCIYGPRQFGMEDQGWLAWFAIRALQHFPITIYGDGKQVRDVLYIDDLVAAYDAAVASISKTDGQAYNVGGGPENTLSLLELIHLLEEELGYRIEHTFAEWRPGDQLVFISDIQKAMKDFGWKPLESPEVGVGHLIDWLRQNPHLFTVMAD